MFQIKMRQRKTQADDLEDIKSNYILNGPSWKIEVSKWLLYCTQWWTFQVVFYPNEIYWSLFNQSISDVHALTCINIRYWLYTSDMKHPCAITYYSTSKIPQTRLASIFETANALHESCTLTAEHERRVQ